MTSNDPEQKEDNDSQDNGNIEVDTNSEEIQEKSLEINEETNESDENLSDASEGDDDSEDLQKKLLEFADLEGLDDLSEEDLRDMEEAIAENVQESESLSPDDTLSEEELEIEKEEFKPEIGDDLEAKMEEELAKKRKAQGIKTITKEDFIQYLSERKTKIVYHALWYLTFDNEDHEASKAIIYDALKEVTSKNPVEPLEEHKFYFGLGFILRLKLYDQKVVQFKGGKLKVMINIENLKEILNVVGDPISERPILTSNEKEAMFSDFLKDDFLDI
ncbi:hypothetical protein [Candidatus Lokiarchaeum ossiferum]|uniref:hypothetical protein n=1 Tax=Candidatus Lokiarchaeum ossiferum TaxID=2951803 RepID=UPI00352C4470